MVCGNKREQSAIVLVGLCRLKASRLDSQVTLFLKTLVRYRWLTWCCLDWSAERFIQSDMQSYVLPEIHMVWSCLKTWRKPPACRWGWPVWLYVWAPNWKLHTYSFCRGSLPKFYSEAIYKEIIDTFESCFWDCQLVMAYHSLLKARTRLIIELLEDFAATFQQLAHHTLVGLSQYIQKEATYGLFNRIRDQ